MSPPEPLRLLFIARAFPPTLGGMETFAERLSDAMGARADVTPIVNRRGKKALPAFLPFALAAAVRLAHRERAQAIHLADALLAPLGVALKNLTGLPVTASVCGLDVTYSNPLYQALVPRSLARLDMTMPISEATATQMRERGGNGMPTNVVPLGVNPLPQPDDDARRSLRHRIGRNGDNGPVVLTVGRLIERKGVAWFAEHVLPKLPANTTYVVIGEGPERDTIVAAATRGGVAERVRLLGRLPDAELAAAYRVADVFVMPNVPVTGDMEGFGLVALEAAASGLPVVASRLEGITEAIVDGSNGMVVAPCDANAYAATLNGLLVLNGRQRSEIGARFAAYTDQHFGWDRTARRYVDLIQSVAA